ncbi:hypothetical protein Hanom_Chr05g00407501 [Helianthus anomalus]
MHVVKENVGLNVFEVAECQMEERDGLGNLKGDGGAGFGNRRTVSGSPTFPLPHEEHVQCGNVSGVNKVSGPGPVNSSGVFFFFSDDESKNRPNKKEIRLRPRSVRPGRKGIPSPVSGERPRKRNRETGEFLFDLNEQAAVLSSDIPQDGSTLNLNWIQNRLETPMFPRLLRFGCSQR